METAGKALRAAGYERVSTLAGGSKARSIDEQNGANDKAIAEHGWIRVGTYQDPGRSASRFARRAREEYGRLIRDLEAGAFDVLVLWESSRGGRNLTIWSQLLDACRKHGVLIWITNHRHLYDLSVRRDWRALADEGVDSADESEKISSNVRRAMDANARDGKPHGRCPFGYERVYDPQTRELIEQRPYLPAAEIVREIIRRIAEGEPRIRIADDLLARDAISPAGGKWNAAAVSRIAANPAYIGKRRSRFGMADAIWPAIVDEVTWHAAQRQMDGTRRARTRPGRQRWMLSYIPAVSCARCGSWLSVALAAEGGGVRHGNPLYCCVNGCVSMRQDWLDRYIVALMAERLSDEQSYALLTGGDSDGDVMAARAEADEIGRRLDGFALQAARKEIADSALAIIEAELRPQKAAAEKRAEQAAPPVLRTIDPTEDIREQILAAHVSAQKAMVRLLFTEIRIGPALMRGRQRTFDPRRVSFEWRKPN